MLGKSKSNKSVSSTGPVTGLEGSTTLIARSSRVSGDVYFQDQLYVNGVIEGDVRAEDNEGATLVVCAGGVVRGEIRAPNVVIDGTVEGDVYATGKLELAAKGRVMGNVHYNLVEMQLGAIVNGQMVSLEEAVGEATVVQASDTAAGSDGLRDLSAAHATESVGGDKSGGAVAGLG